MFASRSARESESSAKAGSRAVRGEEAWISVVVEEPLWIGVWEVRKEVRERERRGVVGRLDAGGFEDIIFEG